MKIRTDFVTNSSSSSFSVVISVETKDGKKILFEESPWEYNVDDGGYVKFYGNLSNILTKDGKRLKPKYSNIEELAKYLVESVSDDLYDEFGEEEFEEDDYSEELECFEKRITADDVQERKEDFVKKVVEVAKTVDDISKIRIEHEYSAWGEFADLIPDNDGPLCELAERVVESSGDEQKKHLDKMREYINTPQGKARQGESFASDHEDIRYIWDGDDADLIQLANRLCSGYAADASEGVEIEELNLETKEHVKFAEFNLC